MTIAGWGKKSLRSNSSVVTTFRVDNSKKGGDIDILILSDRELKRKEKASIEFDFFKKFGEQKLDLVSYKYDAKDSFKELALQKAVAL